ncbi:MAG TPA: hypothetical protein ENH40_01615 [Nitrospirae bacterium]|nr:hypothetical protein [Nitrospirota bacterium]
MEPVREEIFRQKHMVFIGKVLACFPHSIRNRLATIRETAGLMGDLLRQEDQWSEDDQKKFTGILSTIENHVNILARKNEYLDRFAQRMGKTFTTLDLREVVEEVVSFSSRFAHLRRVSLTLDAAKTLPSIYSDPLLIYFIVSIMIDDLLERVERGGKVIVRVEQINNEMLIEAQGCGTLDTAAPSTEERNKYWLTGQQVVNNLGGRLKTSAIGSDMRQTSLFLPIKQVSKDI